jgi:hypothetical protein
MSITEQCSVYKKENIAHFSTVKRSELMSKDMLGMGISAVVFKGKINHTAWRVIARPDSEPNAAFEACLASKKGVGPTFLNAAAVADVPGSARKIAVQTELMDVTLAEVLRSALPKGPDFPQWPALDASLVSLLNRMNEQAPVCHMDLHMENVMLTNDLSRAVAVDWDGKRSSAICWGKNVQEAQTNVKEMFSRFYKDLEENFETLNKRVKDFLPGTYFAAHNLPESPSVR